jgi:hypothetical protein
MLATQFVGPCDICRSKIAHFFSQNLGPKKTNKIEKVSNPEDKKTDKGKTVSRSKRRGHLGTTQQ